MSSSIIPPYRLRANKAADRELFLSLLTRLSGTLPIEKYKYIGMGGPFLEDFRLMHSRLGIQDMVCVETDEEVHKRQQFNKPFPNIQLVHSTIEDYLDSTELESSVIVWLDYTSPNEWHEQLERFAWATANLSVPSIIRITLNANPSSLGKPPEDAGADAEKLRMWRLEAFRGKIGTYFCPSDLEPSDMTRRAFGKAVLKALKLAVEKEALSHDREVVWPLFTHYADGQPMVTATALILDAKEGNPILKVIDEWEFYSHVDSPHTLALPALSTRERLIMESSDNPKIALGYKLPSNELEKDPYDSFAQYYRIYPHYTKIDL